MREKGKPLSPDELETLQKEAVRPSATLPITIVPATGIFPAEYLHLSDDWINWPTDHVTSPDHPIIEIPKTDDCKRKAVKRGHNATLTGITSQDGPCGNCRASNREQFRSPGGKPAEGKRHVPIIDESAATKIDWWFSKYETIPWARDLTHLNVLANREIGRSVTLTDLRWTFLRRALEMGLSKSQIQYSMGVEASSDRFSELFRKFGSEQREHYGIKEYLTTINQYGPVTIAQLRELLGRSDTSVRRVISNLEEEDFVKQVEPIIADNGHEATRWINIVPPNTPLTCPKPNCDRVFLNFQARSTHLTRSHD